MKRTVLTLIIVAGFSLNAHAQQENDYPSEPLPDVSSLGTVPTTRQERVNFTLNGEVTAIEDGDTITLQGVQNKFRIRFSDMDTPETAHDPFTPPGCRCNPLPYRPGQPGGLAARASLLEMLKLGDAVRAECYEMDDYGRAVCHVFKGATNLNLEQIRRGWGWLATKSKWIRDPDSAPAEDQARSSRVGAWALPNQVHPDTWRRQCWREATDCSNAEPKP
jgi:endonuclease YncB( thermonuclease family)